MQLDATRALSTGPDTPYALQGIIALPSTAGGPQVAVGDMMTFTVSHDDIAFKFVFPDRSILSAEELDIAKGIKAIRRF